MGLFNRAEPNIEDMKKRNNIKGLLKELQSSNSSRIRKEIAEALDDLGWKPQDDVQKSYYLLGKQSWKELKEIGKPAIKILIRQLTKSEHPGPKQEAVTFLGELGDPEAIGPLLTALLSGAVGSVYVLRSIEKFDKSSVNKFILRLIESMARQRGISDIFPVPAMILAGPSKYQLQEQIVEILPRMGELAIDPLIQSLKNRDADIRGFAAFALGKMKTKRAIPSIQKLQSDENPFVQFRANEVLKELVDEKPI